MAAIGGRGGGNDDVTVTLTARQWDVAVAALDTWGLVAFTRGDTAGAEQLGLLIDLPSGSDPFGRSLTSQL